jgi:hypothetical protein
MVVLRILCIMAMLYLSCSHGNERDSMREAKDDEVNEMSPADMKLKAIEVADADMKKGGADLSLYRIEIVEDSISFKIHYILKDSLMLLGGVVAWFVFRKGTLL